MNLQRIRRPFPPNFSFRSKAGLGTGVLCLSSSLLALSGIGAGAQGLQISYGSKGVQSLSYNGVALENLSSFSGDAFHIWHMKATDLSGNVVGTGQYGWGENNNGESWNAQTNTETYNFTWGSIATQFVQTGNTLDMIVTETNYGSSGILFDGAEIFPLALHFPKDPTNFYGYTQYAITTTDPGVSIADFGSGVVTSVVPDESAPLYAGWKNAGGATYTPMMTSTAPDGLATFLPHNDRPVQPGTSFTYTVSLRFTPEGTPANTDDAYASFAATYPSQMTWSDKRILGTAYLASSPANSDATQPGGYPTNPRRYFNDPSTDITTPAGLQTFQNRILAQAASNVVNAGNMSGQGVITWDLEGEQYPQTTSYVCSPDQIAAVAPEMESTVSDPASAFHGEKLDDAYFKTMTTAGLKVGLCLRPQVFTFGPNGTASQVSLNGNAAIVANLETKARYANSRWGATIFYVDSTVNPDGGTLDPAIFQQLITDLPNLLFIPEESTTRYYAYTAPFYSFIFHTTTGTSSSVYSAYPNAFGANLVNDVSSGTLSTYQPQLTNAVGKGDILMGHADYWQANDPTLVSIYAAAGVHAPAPPVQPTTPTLTWPAPAAITYGTALSTAQLDASASVTGTFTYSPALGTVPSAGMTTLTATFTPTNTNLYKAASTTVSLTVVPASPVVSWTAPASLTAGTALSATQLSATANVAGTFTYTPALGSVLPAGNNTLVAVFTPADTTEYKAVTTQVLLNITQATVTVSWSTPASLVYGTSLSAAQLNAAATVPGSFKYTPGAGTVLPVGGNTLSVTFTPADSATYKAVITSVNLSVTQASPVVSWSTPASITAGTALSAAQLNATANVPGSFTYTPAVGSVPAAGNQTLSVTFTPTDAASYKPASASVTLIVSPAQVTPLITWATPRSITYGLPLTGIQLNAKANVAGSFIYSPAVGTVLLAGIHTITARFTPANSAYPTVTATRNITVVQATPKVAWTVPAAVPFGTALTAEQLNATANVPAAFTYSVKVGSVLSVGTHAVKVTFKPTDAVDYKTTTASISVIVNTK